MGHMTADERKACLLFVAGVVCAIFVSKLIGLIAVGAALAWLVFGD